MNAPFKEYLRTHLPWPVLKIIKRFREEWKVLLSKKDITSLARIYQTDKVSRHFYTLVYEQWFRDFRFKKIKLLEIGIGGYGKLHMGGNSLRMWKSYFPKGSITGIDLYDKTDLGEHRINIYKGNQADVEFLKSVSGKDGPFDIIVDDGSHMQSHILASFKTLFPLLASGGIYVVEDTQTSYWPKFEGSTAEMDSIPSAMNYFIRRIHEVNKTEWLKDDLQKELPTDDISAIAFYHNLIFIKKG